MPSFEINQTVDIATQTENERKAFATASVGDRMAHTWNVSVTRNGAPVDLTGALIAAYMMRENNTRVFLVGQAQGNKATVTFPSVTYAIQGTVDGLMRITRGDNVITVARVRISVGPNLCCEVVDPGEVIPNIEDLLLLSAFAEAAAAAAERAAERAEGAADKADAATAAALAIARTWSNADATITTLPPGSEATVNIVQFADKVTFEFGIPKIEGLNATLFVDNLTTMLYQVSPAPPVSGIDFVFNKHTTELYMRINA